MYSPFTEIPAAGNAVFVNEMNGLDEIGLLSPFANEDESSSVLSFEDDDVLQTMEDEDSYAAMEHHEEGQQENYLRQEDVLFESEVNYAKAKEWNDKYSRELRWNLFDVEIYKLLGYEYTSPTDDELVDSVASWQRQSGLSADGMIGPGTWSAMLQEIIATTAFTHVSIRTAIPANQKLKKILGWEKFQTSIYKVLGFHGVSPSEELFAKAIALWQPKLGFAGKSADGRLGEKTWAAIRTHVLKEVEKERQIAVIPEIPAFYPAIIKAEKGIYLHTKPADYTKQTDVLYRRGELVYVIATSVISSESGWCKITTQDKRTGWIQLAHLERMTIDDLGSPLIKRPPGAYLVNPGDKLDTLVQIFYPDYEIEMGNDRRTIVHAFSILNRDNDAVYYEGTSSTWWRNHVLDRDMEKTRTIYETIRLKADRLIYFPTEAYIKWLRDEKLVGVRSDWKNTAIEVGKSIYGFLKGVEEGFKEACIDTLKGLWDFIKDLFTGELFRQIYDLYQEFSKYTVTEALSKIWDLIKSIVGDKVDQIKREFNLIDPEKRFFTIGKLVGNILFEVAIALLTWGVGLAAKALIKSRALIQLLSKSQTLTRIYNSVDPKTLRKTVAGFSNIQDLNNYIALGTAVVQAIDAITNIAVEGIQLDAALLTNEVHYESDPSSDFQVITEDEQLNELWSKEAEEHATELFRKGDPGLTKQNIHPMSDIIPGQYNRAGHGIDMFGFSITPDGKINIYIIEVKGGNYPNLRVTKRSGLQMGQAWIENAVDRALLNEQLAKKLKEAFEKHHPGKSFDNTKMREMLLKKAQRVLIVSKDAVPEALIGLRKLVRMNLFKKLTMIEREQFPLADYVFADEESYEDSTLFENYTPKKPVLVRRLWNGKGYMAFDVASNVRATTANQKNFTASKLSMADIRTALSKWVNLKDIQDMLLDHNKLSPGNPYTITGSTTVDAVFTEAVHQFQVANYLNPDEQDGILGPSTLDTMGFDTHGLRAKLSSSGFDGQKKLNWPSIKPHIPTQTNNEFTSANWFEFILRPAWLGVKISQGVHLLLLRKLREAENWLLQQPAYRGMTPAQLGKAMGMTASSSYSAARLSGAEEAMHGVGLAIDVNSWGNPWVGAGWISTGNTEKTRMIRALRNAANNQSLPGSTIFAYLHSIAQSTGANTRQCYDTLRQHNDEFIALLTGNAAERQYWNDSYSFGSRNPLHGFLNLHSDLVHALRQVAGLAWGAIDFGPNASGDIMHFDLRTIGIGKIICDKIGGFVPSSGHPTITPPTTTPEINDESYNDFVFENEPEHHEAVGEAAWGRESEDATEGEAENVYQESQVPTSAIDPVALNQQYSRDLGWGEYSYEINDLLLQVTGQQGMSLSGSLFTSAVAAWQRKNGLFSNVGVIDAITWTQMKPQVSDFMVQQAIRSWGDKAVIAAVLKKIVYLNLGHPMSLAFDKMTALQKTAFTTEWNKNRGILLEGRKQFILSGNIPPLGKAKVPFGFFETLYHGIRGLGTFNRYNKHLASQRADEVILSLHQRGKLSCTQDELDLFQRVANAETYGMIQLLNSYDRGVVSIGFLQFTIHVGKIQKWIKLAEPAFKKYGIELDPVETYAYGSHKFPAIKGVPGAKIDQLRWNGWAERFYYAGLDPDVIVGEIQLVKQYFTEHLSDLKARLGNITIYNTFVNSYYNSSPYVRGLFQASFNNNPARSTSCVRAAVSAFSTPASVATFVTKYTAVLTANDWEGLVGHTAHGTALTVTAPGSTPEVYGNGEVYANEAISYEQDYNGFATEDEIEVNNEHYQYQVPTVPNAPAAPPAKNWCDIRNMVAYVLGQAELDWFEVYDPAHPDGRFRREDERNPDRSWKMIDYLQEYWEAVRGTGTPVPAHKISNPRTQALNSINDTVAWSAAFVSWAMKLSGVEESDGFIFSRRHITYIVQALSNARRNDAQRPVHLRNVTTPVAIGDILCFNVPAGSGFTNYTLDNLARDFLNPTTNLPTDLANIQRASHCDVVKEFITEDGIRYAVVVGGNKSIPPGTRGYTVASRNLRIDQNNVLVNPAAIRNPGSCFGVIKLGTCTTVTTNEVNDFETEAYETDEMYGQETGTDMHDHLFVDEYGTQEAEMDNYSLAVDEIEGLITNWSNAIRNNQYYSTSLGWNNYYDQINTLLLPYSGMYGVSLGEEAFAQAVAAWQQQQGLTADGVIGPTTWGRMQPFLNRSQPAPTPAPAPSWQTPATSPGATPPPVQQVFNFNQWHAQKILDSINAGIVTVNTGVTYNPKTQLEQIAQGKKVLNVNPNSSIVQILPIIYHICQEAGKQNYRDIIIGSFIRAANSDGSCTGHCAGRCIDINFKGGSFSTSGSVQMVINIFNYLMTIPSQYKKSFGFGLPLQGSFFGNKSLPKFSSTSPSNLIDPTLRQQVPKLGIVFPDNDNHLHIQVKWI